LVVKREIDLRARDLLGDGSAQRSILDNHLNPCFTGKLGEISRRAVDQYVTLRSRQVSAGTVRKEVGCLKHLLTWAMEDGLIPSNSATRITMPKVLAGRLRYLQPTELDAVVERCPPWIRPVLLLAVSTGIRRGEIFETPPTRPRAPRHKSATIEKRQGPDGLP
jgi:site-specific recombinase XerD